MDCVNTVLYAKRGTISAPAFTRSYAECGVNRSSRLVRRGLGVLLRDTTSTLGGEEPGREPASFWVPDAQLTPETLLSSSKATGRPTS